MPAESEKQRKMMAIAEKSPSKLYKRNKGVLKMSSAKRREFMHKAYSPDSCTPEGQRVIG